MRHAPSALLLLVAFVGAVPFAGAQEIERKTTPVLIREFKPNYTKEAREAKIQGIVEMSAVVPVSKTFGFTFSFISLKPGSMLFSLPPWRRAIITSVWRP